MDSFRITLNKGAIIYHFIDIYQFFNNYNIKKIKKEDLNEVKNLFIDKKQHKSAHFGIAHNKNIVIIQLESFQAFLIELKINNKEITPFLNSLLKESVYFNRFFSQAHKGRTSDAVFCVLNSLLPIESGAIAFRKKTNTFYALPKILHENGYSTLAADTYYPAFWNNRQMWEKYGIDKKLFSDDLKSEQMKHGDFIHDDVLYKKSFDEIKKLQSPFFAMVLSNTTHAPFHVPTGHSGIDIEEFNGTLIHDYLNAANFADKQLKVFIDYFKSAGIYTNTVFIIYGDHSGIPFSERKRIQKYETDLDACRIEEVNNSRVPLFVLMPGHSEARVISDYSGQIDIAPTILDLLGIDSENFFLGESLFSKKKYPCVYFISGKILSDNEKNNAIHNKAIANDRQIQQALEKMDASNKINEYNLIPVMKKTR
jgi:phosphoglycerol transferase MdoB-like AlkP superfamily enzyme